MTESADTPKATAQNPSPNDLLARQITDALVTGGLVKNEHKAALLKKLVFGGVTQDEWMLWIDAATRPCEQQGGPCNG